MAKSLLETKKRDEDVYEAKIELAKELAYYDKVKDNEQIKALVDFLEYLFLIQDPELEKSMKTIEIAKNLLDVLDNETIAVKTGLPVEVIEKLR